jgi:hypothetical protein
VGRVPLSLPTPRSRQADRFQLAIETGPDTSSAMLDARLGGQLGGYVAVAGRLAELVPTTSLRPDPAYRAELHSRLLELASARAAHLPAQPAPARDRPATQRGRSVGAARFGRRWRRTLASGTAAVVALLLGVGVAAGSALPGGPLYPVKELIQSAQVQLAHGDLARGRVLLSQARGHISDSSTLVSQGAPDPADVDTALRQAGDDLARGSRLLLAQYAASHQPDALTALSGFTVSQSPLLGRLRDRVPVVSEPLIDQLLAQIGQNAVTLQRTVGQCGAPCAGVSLVNLPGPDGLPAATPGGSAGTSGSSATGLGGIGQSGLGSLTDGSGLDGLLGTGGGSAGSGSSAGGAGGVASVGSDGVGVRLPGVGATVPAPHVGATSGGVQVGVPGPTAKLGPVTVPLPGVSVTLGVGQSSSTHPPVNSASTPPTVCLLIICLGG